ncbi:DUF4870 domain-containing protein [Psychrobacter sp. AOP22-C1-22]|uniref:DUF4870 domain-containing protein n=1 Tax=unclassified Psychrobacter TaxID=196806 RepID=UPI0017877E12|nr:MULTISPECIES: DUF4870 domain-containing protein [unclassified Psychrobacter]MBE0406817.1 DUF4870 domain-containing protein [Psychrobacter sp. FME6]MBE0446373.1 DUF4870 domain-containing protein [Psychrobacter sp. FME5]
MPNSTQQPHVNINKDTGNNTANAQENLNSTAIQATNTQQDSTNIALLNWLGCLFFGFIPPLVIMLTKKDDPYVQSQAKEALNWCITFFITYIVLWIAVMIVGFILAFIWSPLALLPMMFLFLYPFVHPVFCIMGAVKSSAGKDFRVPFNIRLIK